MALSSLQLEAFYVLAQCGQFTAAGKRLGITQSALSQRISNLEEDLGTTLFIRDRTGPKLTEAGLELLRFCQAKEGLEAEVISLVRNGQKNQIGGVLRIAGFSTVMDSVVLPSLAPLLITHPNIQLVGLTAELVDLPELLRTGKVDFIVSDQAPKQHGIQGLFMGEESYVLVEKRGAAVPNIYLDHDEDDQTTHRYCKLAGIKGRIQRHFLDDVSGIIAATALGLGKAVLPVHLVKKLSHLRILNPRMRLTSNVYLHYYNQAYYTKLHELTVEALQVGVPKHLGT